MKMNKILTLLILSLFLITSVYGKKEEPVKVEQVFTEKGDSVYLTINFKLSENWMVYDSIIGDGGPIPLTFDFSVLKNIVLVKIYKPTNLLEKYDDIFEVNMLYFKENVSYKFVFVKIDTNKSYNILGSLQYMCCNLISGICLAPKVIELKQK
tara:strand:+ start:322 stop:780 length:459 start_codon:yes stop_codon:yes gene_type:complete